MYYLLHHQYLKGGATAVAPIAESDDKDKLIADYHSAFAYDMISEDVLGAMVKIYDQNGNDVLTDYWQKAPKVAETAEEVAE